jgi:hypothetical protein
VAQVHWRTGSSKKLKNKIYFLFPPFLRGTSHVIHCRRIKIELAKIDVE